MINIARSLLPKDEEYCVAVSMGIDSLGALFWLKNKGYKVTAIHFNHNLRPQNKVMQDKFVEMCSQQHIKHVTDTGYGLKTENSCRQARLEFYKSNANGKKIVTAHHLNDWVESYLMNCFRGHPERNAIGFCSEFDGFTILHPFLPSKKSDFKQYLERNGLMEYVVEDESNAVVKGSRRNWLRNHIIPSMNEQQISLENYANKRIKQMLQELN